MAEFIENNHLDLSVDAGKVCENTDFDVRAALGSHSDSDHVYNTPRAWYMLKCLNPDSCSRDGNYAKYSPESDDLPWCMVPERKITVEDVKYILSSHYQGTPYDPYLAYGDKSMSGAYRSIGINRTDFLGMVQIRPDLPEACRAIQWLAFGSNAFNAIVPFYPNVPRTEDYLSSTTGEVTTDTWYWTSRLIAALADASFKKSQFHIERYTFSVQSKVRAVIREADRKIPGLQADSGAEAAGTPETAEAILLEANRKVAKILREESQIVLKQVLDEASNLMKNQFSRSDA
jgi:dipeptidase